MVEELLDRVAPDDPVRSLRLSNLHLQLGDLGAAEARWRKVQELAPDDLGTAIGLAYASWKRDGLDTAVGALEHALSLLHRLDDWRLRRFIHS